MIQPFRTLIACVLLLAAAGTVISQDRLGPFTHAPRSVRSRTLDLEHIRLELTLDWETQQILGQAVLRLAPLAAAERISLDAREMTIERADFLPDGDKEPRPLKFEQFDDHVTVELGERVPAGKAMTLALRYRITKPRHGGHFVVPDAYEPDQARSFWTQSEPEYARYWFPCYDAPNDRLTSEVLVTVPDGYFVLSNGELESKTVSADGTCTWHWIAAQDHVPYLISVVAGQFESLEQEWNGIRISSYVPKGMAAQAERSFGKTAAMVQYFSKTIGVPYPWPKYAQICVDEYMWGGMEHTSATTLTLRTLHDERAELDTTSVPLVAHELAHQWWGDLLTCKDWAEIWLNESFATYFETLWKEHDEGWDEAAWERRENAQEYFVEDAKRYRRPIVTYRYPSPGSMFDRHSYPKGGLVLHMLRYVLGDEAFFKALRHYATKHQHGVVETTDLRIAIEEATGQGLNWFFDQWLYHGGHPEYEVRWEWDDNEHLARVHVKQVQKVDTLTPLFRMPIEIDLVTAGKTETHKVTVANKEETFSFALPERPTRVLFDPRGWVLKKLAFDKSKQEWLGQLADDPNVACRLEAIEALRKQTDDAAVRDALIHTAASDKFWGVRKTAVEALGKFAGDAVRAALLQAARTDGKAHVRRAAISQLGELPHDETKAALRAIIQTDRSYGAVADALRALVKVDKDHCQADLYAALEVPSHQEQILGAACEALVERKDEGARDKLLALLEPPSPAQRRVAVLGALGKLAHGDPAITKAIAGQLDDARMHVRRAAIDALGKTEDPGAIALLKAQQAKEDSPRTHRAIDEAIKKLQAAGGLPALTKEVEALQRKNHELEERLRKLEEARE